MLQLPFEIGQTYWKDAGSSRRVTTECPMCCGYKRVTVTIGTGETYEVECEECRLGYSDPRGVIEQWSSTPAAESFTIASIQEWREGVWQVKATDGETIDFDRLFATEEEALAAAVERKEALEERNMAQLRKKKHGKVSSWTIHYHLRQIADYEKKIAWHRSKIHDKT